MSETIYENMTRTDFERRDRERVEMMMNIYESADGVRDHPLQNTGKSHVKNRSSRGAPVCLMLLCFLQLTAVIVLCVHIYTHNTNYTQERNQTRNTNLTEEIIELLIKISNIKEERNQIQTKINNLTEERVELLTKITHLTEEKVKLLTNIINLKEERAEQGTEITNLTEERDQLLTKMSNLKEEKEQLHTNITRLIQLYADLLEQKHEECFSGMGSGSLENL